GTGSMRPAPAPPWARPWGRRSPAGTTARRGPPSERSPAHCSGANCPRRTIPAATVSAATTATIAMAASGSTGATPGGGGDRTEPRPDDVFALTGGNDAETQNRLRRCRPDAGRGRLQQPGIRAGAAERVDGGGHAADA